MIIYGISMQDKPHEVPEEVAVWLLEQQARYPLIDFQIDYSDYDDAETGEARQKYSQIWNGSPSTGFGVSSVMFLYLKESWFIRIIGGRDTQGNIADRDIPHDSDDPRRSVDPLGPALRAEISAMPPLEELEFVGEDNYGLPRKPDAVVEDRASKLTPVPADMHWTSDLRISGAELHDLFHGVPSDRKAEIVEAIAAKDWERARELLKQRH